MKLSFSLLDCCRQLAHFAIHPKQNVRTTLNPGDAFRMLRSYFIIDFGISSVVAVLTIFILQRENIGLERISHKFEGLSLLLVGVIVLPLLEELIFRLPLLFKPLYQVTSIILGAYCILFLSLRSHTGLDPWLCIFYSMVVSIALGIYCYHILKRYEQKAKFLFKKYFVFIFYFSVCSFGFLHITNYHVETRLLPFLFLLTLPQIISAFILGYLRIRYGLLYSYALHGMVNFFPLIIA